MGQVANGIEVLQRSNDLTSYRKLPALATSTWEQDAVLYWDTSANVVKKFAPADSTEVASLQSSIIGLAQAGKKSGENEAMVAMEATILADASNINLGAKLVVKYNATNGRYTFHEDSAYDTAIDPDISLTLNFAVCVSETAEADGRSKIAINGLARFNALS
jgi:hypothetical protein